MNTLPIMPNPFTYCAQSSQIFLMLSDMERSDRKSLNMFITEFKNAITMDKDETIDCHFEFKLCEITGKVKAISYIDGASFLFDDIYLARNFALAYSVLESDRRLFYASVIGIIKMDKYLETEPMTEDEAMDAGYIWEFIRDYIESIDNIRYFPEVSYGVSENKIFKEAMRLAKSSQFQELRSRMIELDERIANKETFESRGPMEFEMSDDE